MNYQIKKIKSLLFKENAIKSKKISRKNAHGREIEYRASMGKLRGAYIGKFSEALLYEKFIT
jgi:hypothetical protein